MLEQQCINYQVSTQHLIAVELPKQLIMLHKLQNYLMELVCSSCAPKSPFFLMYCLLINYEPSAGGRSRFFNLQRRHPRAVSARQDRASQQGVHEDAEHGAHTRRQDEGVHASAHCNGVTD